MRPPRDSNYHNKSIKQPRDNSNGTGSAVATFCRKVAAPLSYEAFPSRAFQMHELMSSETVSFEGCKASSSPAMFKDTDAAGLRIIQIQFYHHVYQPPIQWLPRDPL